MLNEILTTPLINGVNLMELIGALAIGHVVGGFIGRHLQAWQARRQQEKWRRDLEQRVHSQ